MAWGKRGNEEKNRNIMGDYGNEPITSLSVRKSNDFVAAKYKSSLLENQIMAIALTRIEINNKDAESPLEAKLFPGELKRLISDPSHIYRDLKKISKTIPGHTMFIEDGKGNFESFSIVTNATYQDGIFTVKFNSVLRDHILGLEKNYTTLELSVMTDFKRNSSFRLYELLKKDAYKIPPKPGGSIQVEYNISEIRFIIGLANADEPDVKRALANMGNSIDWDALFEKLDKRDRKYSEWRDFQKYILKTAQEELEEKSDIRFEYEGIKEGRRTKRVRFTIYRNTPKNPEIIDERQQILEINSMKIRQAEMPYDSFPELYDELVGHNKLTKEDVDLLLEKALFKEDVVRSAIKRADEQGFISNYMGWLIRYIERGGYGNVETIEGSVERADKAREMKESYERDKESTAAKMWEKVKQKKEYPAFVAMLEDENINPDMLESIYTPLEIVKMYTDWSIGRPIEF